MYKNKICVWPFPKGPDVAKETQWCKYNRLRTSRAPLVGGGGGIRDRRETCYLVC